MSAHPYPKCPFPFMGQGGCWIFVGMTESFYLFFVLLGHAPLVFKTLISTNINDLHPWMSLHYITYRQDLCLNKTLMLLLVNGIMSDKDV